MNESRITPEVVRQILLLAQPQKLSTETSMRARTRSDTPLSDVRDRTKDEFSHLHPLMAAAMRFGKGHAGYYGTEALGLPSNALQGGSLTEALGRIGALGLETIGMMAKFSPKKAPVNTLRRDVFHGSPYKFTRFNAEKIGTGEGAQAYGHGFYFAEDPKIGEFYSKSTSNKDFIKKVAGFYDSFDTADEAHDMLKAEAGLSLQQIKLLDVLKKNDWWGFDHPAQAVKAALTENPKNWDAGPEEMAAIQNLRNVYKVHIPDEHIQKMLDWDKPLSGQSDFVRKALNEAIAGSPEKTQKWAAVAQQPRFQEKFGVVPTGSTLYEILSSDTGGHKAATDLLKEHGVTGIRYKDAPSRGKEGGTSNYVVFDPASVRVLERNGKKVIIKR